MRRRRSYLLWSAAGAVLGMQAAGAMAQTVQLSIVASAPSNGTGTWSVYAATDSGTDNIGLATFAIDVIGSGGVTVTGSYEDAPIGTVTSGAFKGDRSGFTEFPSNGQGGGAVTFSGSVSPPVPGNGIAITAGQNVAYGSAHSAANDLEVLQGFGKFAQIIPTEGVTWSFPALLADGTYSATGSGGVLTVQPDLSIGAGLQTLNEVSGGKWVGPGNISYDNTVNGTVRVTLPPTIMPTSVIGSTPIGTSLGPELVETGGEPYNFLTLTESSPVVTGNFQFTGFHEGDAIDVLLKFASTTGGDPAPGDLANIIAYINGNDGTEGIIASAVPASLSKLYPGYDVLYSTTAPAGDPYFDFDFSRFGDPSIPTGSLGVIGVGLVPEPSRIGLLALGGLALVRRPRKKRF
jgi:hypothetical protein